MPRQHPDQDREKVEKWEHDSDVDTLTLWSYLTTIRTNPLNDKCLTLPILRLDNPYSVNFHLLVYQYVSVECSLTFNIPRTHADSSWLGFWVAL